MLEQAVVKQEIDTKKIEIITFIAKIDKFDLLLQIEDLIKASSVDWWNIISKTDKEKIEEGLNEIQEGKIVSHEMVLKNVEEKINSLNR